MENSPTWRKAKGSDAKGQCVEVAAVGQVVGVRDSKAPDVDIRLSHHAFTVLLNTIKAGRHDL